MNVLMLCIDSMRFDCLNHSAVPFLYNYTEKKGQLFPDSFSHSSWTRPSIATVLTGLLPQQHRVEFIESKLGKEKQLPEFFKEKGYATACFSGINQIDPVWGFRGFDEFFSSQVDSVQLNRRLMNFVRAAKESKKKWFAYVHYADPHFPYNMSTSFFKRNPKKEIKELLWDAYNKKLNTIDCCINQLFDFLNGLKVMKKTLVVVFADHGEEFWEHGHKIHGGCLCDEVLHVPLIFFHPKMPAKCRPKVAGLADLGPTITKEALKENPFKKGKNLFYSGERKHIFARTYLNAHHSFASGELLECARTKKHKLLKKRMNFRFRLKTDSLREPHYWIKLAYSLPVFFLFLLRNHFKKTVFELFELQKGEKRVSIAENKDAFRKLRSLLE